jgi:hypothetical protein
MLVGRIIVKQGASSGTVQSAFDTVFQFGNVINHNDTGNLNTGDYLHLTATEYSNISNGRFSSLSASTLTATTYWSGSTPLSTIISSFVPTSYPYLPLSGGTLTGQLNGTIISATTLSSSTLGSTTERIITTSGTTLLQNYMTTDVEYITSATVITNITSVANWLYNSYTGSTVGLVEGQKYQDDYFLYIYSNSTLRRIKNSTPGITLFNAYGSASTASDIVVCSASTAFTLMLPPPSLCIFQQFVVKNIGAGAITLSATTATIDGNTSVVVPQWGAPNLFVYSNNYLIF